MVVRAGTATADTAAGISRRPGPHPLAREVLHNSPVYGDKRPAYAVEFENGERLCTLHRRPDGVLDQFQCI